MCAEWHSGARQQHGPPEVPCPVGCPQSAPHERPNGGHPCSTRDATPLCAPTTPTPWPGAIGSGPVLGRTPGSCAHRAYDELLQRTVRLTLVEPDPTTSDSGAFTLRPQGWQDRDPELAELYDAGSDGDRRFLVTHHPEEPTLAETTPPGGLDLAQLRDLGTSIA